MALGRWHKRILCAFHCTEHSDEPLKTKSCSALASTIFESPLHRTKVTCTIFFVPSAKRRCRTDLLTPEAQRELIAHYDEEVGAGWGLPTDMFY